MTNFLDPKEVREWLDNRVDEHLRDGGIGTEGIYLDAWEQFGLAVAASDDMKDDPIRSWDNAVDVARIIRDAGKNGL